MCSLELQNIWHWPCRKVSLWASYYCDLLISRSFLIQTFPSPCKKKKSYIFALRAAAGILNATCVCCCHVYFYSNPPSHRYFLLCVNYFFYGETVTDYFFTLVQREEPLRILSKYHRFISFALYLTGTNTDTWFENETYTNLSLYCCVLDVYFHICIFIL